MSDDTQRPIVVNKTKKAGHGHHGGAWKIAYADFVTAMMAFFLLMWLLGSSTKGDLRGIASYFQNPFAVVLGNGNGSGGTPSLLQGGGLDLSKKAADKTADAGKQRLRDLKRQIRQALDNAAGSELAKFKEQIVIDAPPEGLRIQIVDAKNRPMFKSGSAQMEPYAVAVLHELAVILSQVPNKLSLSGHTDNSVFNGAATGYTNWELSSDRANTSRRELVAGGLPPDRILRIVGQGDSVPYDAQDPTNPVNRRISLIVLNDEATQNIYRLSRQQDVDTLDGTSAAVGLSH